MRGLLADDRQTCVRRKNRHGHDVGPYAERTGRAIEEKQSFAIPASLDRTIMSCLAKQPADRPADADVLASLLEHCEGAGSWTGEDSKHWWHANVAEGSAPPDEKFAPISVDPDALTTL